MLLWLKGGMGSEREIKMLKYMIVLYITLLATDIFWALAESGIYIPEHYINAAINAISITSVALGCYCWYRFVGGRLNALYCSKNLFSKLMNIPIVVICFLNLISTFTGWIFEIRPDGKYIEGPLFWIQCVITFFYLLVPTIDAFIHIFKTRVRSQRIEYISYVVYMLIPFSVVIVEEKVRNVPLLELSIFVVLQVLFLTIYVDREKALMQKEKELTDSRMAIMLSQIQPHFLYNSLEVIQYMCRGKAPEAEQATIEFAQYLRGNLDSLSRHDPIPFLQELQHTKNYLSLEQKRFGEESLIIEYSIETTSFRIPALTLQPIVENAVRYGIRQREGGGIVRISTSETDGNYVIEVCDNGVGFDAATTKPDGRTHIGIDNVRNRLHEMCNGILTISSTPGEGTVAVLTIPKRGNITA